MVEAAIVMPLVMLLLFAVFWAALTARAFLTVDHGVRSGVRTAAIAGSDAHADWRVLRSIRPNLTAFGSQDVKMIVIYRASELGEPPPPACTAPGATSSAANQCNVYHLADLDRPASDFAPGGWSTDDGFPATARAASRSDLTGQYIGVYIGAAAAAPVLSLPAVESVSSFKVLQIEPQTF